MGRLLNDYDNYPGWTENPFKCHACGARWVNVYHMWMRREFLTMCPDCPERAARLDNLLPFRKTGEPSMTYSTAEAFVQPVLQYHPPSKLFRLVESYTLEWGSPDFRKRLTLAAGFEYDKASVPRPFWGIARPDGPWEAAALFHDRMYMDRGEFPRPEEFHFETLVNGEWRRDSSRWTRAQADDLLEMVGILGGADPAEAARYKWAVRLWPPNWFKGF